MATKDVLTDWRGKGFARAPEFRTAGDDGVLMYRCWGTGSAGTQGSTEVGTGYFSSTRPATVSDAELRYNIVDWGNAVNFVSTFRLKPGFAYYIGPVAHNAGDRSIAAMQIYVEPPLDIKIAIVASKEVLHHDVTVIMLNDRNTPVGQERGQA